MCTKPGYILCYDWKIYAQLKIPNSDNTKYNIHKCNKPMFELLIVLTVSLLVVFKVETNNTPTCSVFINSCSLTAAPLASSSKDYIIAKLCK